MVRRRWRRLAGRYVAGLLRFRPFVGRALLYSGFPAKIDCCVVCFCTMLVGCRAGGCLRSGYIFHIFWILFCFLPKQSACRGKKSLFLCFLCLFLGELGLDGVVGQWLYMVNHAVFAQELCKAFVAACVQCAGTMRKTRQGFVPCGAVGVVV